jgi:hypothetical protein
MLDNDPDIFDMLGLPAEPLPPGLLEIIPGLQERLEAAGWQPGAPPHVTLRSLRIDQTAAHRLACPTCGRKAMNFRPYHKGSRYAALAVCGCDGAAEL